MAHQKIELGLVAVLVAMLWTGAVAQSSSCTNVLISLSPCLDYISGNSSSPSSGCCTQLATVVRSQPQCLCEFLSGSGSSNLGLNINQTQAMALPGACNVQTPPISRCSAGSPADTPAGTPETPNRVPSERGSNSVPSTDDNGSSNGSSTKLAVHLLLLLIFLASYGSTFTMS